MDLKPERLYQLPDEEAFPFYQALWYAGLADATIHLHGAQVARRLGRLHSAHTAILQALECNPQGDLKGKVVFLYADLLLETGQRDKAIEYFTQWLNDLETEYPDLRDPLLGAVHYNRGLALREAARYSESLEDYQKACAEFERTNQPDWLRMAWQNLAWVACLLGQEKLAGKALKQAEPLCKSPEAAWQQQISYAFYLLISPDADLQKAMALCKEITSCSDPDVPLAVRSHAYWVGGRVALALDHVADAEAMAERALLWGAAAGGHHRCATDAAALWQEVRARKLKSRE